MPTDYELGILTGLGGPFADLDFCGENMCEVGEPLPYTEPPPGRFPDK